MYQSLIYGSLKLQIMYLLVMCLLAARPGLEPRHVLGPIVAGAKPREEVGAFRGSVGSTLGQFLDHATY